MQLPAWKSSNGFPQSLRVIHNLLLDNIQGSKWPGPFQLLWPHHVLLSCQLIPMILIGLVPQTFKLICILGSPSLCLWNTSCRNLHDLFGYFFRVFLKYLRQAFSAFFLKQSSYSTHYPSLALSLLPCPGFIFFIALPEITSYVYLFNFYLFIFLSYLIF